MSYCPKCGAEIVSSMSFCNKCGTPISQQATKVMPQRPQMPQAPQQAAMPQRPQMPQAPQQAAMPQRPQMPQAPQKAAMPQRPQMPQAPQEKGVFTNVVRSVANAVTGGALNREIAREQQAAVNAQRRDDQGEIAEALTAEQRAERERMIAEREAERARDIINMSNTEGVDFVRGHAIWNIQPGEVARKISELELEQVEKLKGIIVQEGSVAIIFANGELISTLSAGSYRFYKSYEEEQAAIKAAVEKAEKELDEREAKARAERRKASPTFRQLGIVGELGRAVGWVGRIIFGEKKNEDKERAQKRKRDFAKIIGKLTSRPIMSVYLVSTRHISLTYGGELTPDGGLVYKPYTIPVGIHDVEIGVSLQMQINDIHAFATNYLADRSSVSVTYIHQMTSGAVETLLRQSLRNSTYEQSGLDADVVASLKLQIQQTINQQLYGISCVQVLNITDDNREFERFRAVERELYNTEKELDFMHRTGEFRNRMENEANAQEISSAQNAEQLRYSLQQINKDQLLHDDELEEFIKLLESQRRIREAKTETEEYEALEDLRKNILVKDDEMEALEDALSHNKISRDQVTDIMRIQSQLAVDTERQHAEWALDDSRTDHDWERADLERRRNWGIEDEEREREWMREEREYNRDFERRKMEDEYDFDRRRQEEDYDFQKMMRERELRKEDEQLAYERSRQEKFDEDQLEANRSQRQIDKLQAMAQMQAQMDAQKYQHEENIAQIGANERMNRDNTFVNMSAEQIRAAQLDRLSTEGQVAMAQAYGSEKEAAFMREQAEREREMAQKDKADMMNFAERMAAMVRDTAAGVSATQQQRINDLQSENRYQQQRVDRTQDMAMNNISQVSTAAASNINAFNGGIMSQPQPQPQYQAPQPQMIECQCYNCGSTIMIAEGAPQCPQCGAPFQWN